MHIHKNNHKGEYSANEVRSKTTEEIIGANELIKFINIFNF